MAKKRIVDCTNANASKTNMLTPNAPMAAAQTAASSLLGPGTLRANLPTVTRLPQTNQAVPRIPRAPSETSVPSHSLSKKITAPSAPSAVWAAPASPVVTRLPMPLPTSGESLQTRSPGSISAKRPEPDSPARVVKSLARPSCGKNA